MNLIQLAETIRVDFRKSADRAQITFEAGRSYVIANAQLETIMRNEPIARAVYKISRLEDRIEAFTVESSRKNGKVLFYNGSGGYGDQIVTWPVVKLLASMGYEMHVMTEPGNNVCWWNFPWVRSLQLCPMPYEVMKLYDHVVLFESVVNLDEHQDQKHPVDVMLRRLGIDPARVDPKLKVVKPVFTNTELFSTRAYESAPVGLYQLSSATVTRCLPPADSVFIAVKLAMEYPHIQWLCLYDEFVNQDYNKMLEQKVAELTLTNIKAVNFPNLRDLWALTSRAEVVVAPDSMMVHIAGSMGVPCVGLWGPVHPNNRTAYYSNHHPIYHREACPHAPCFAYSSTFPKYCPPRPGRNVCEVLASISPTEVVEAVRNMLKNKQLP